MFTLFSGFFGKNSKGRSGAKNTISSATDLAPASLTIHQKIDDVLTRGVEEIFVRESLEKKLRAAAEGRGAVGKPARPLRIKLGIDPTGKNIHLGNAVILWKLRAFQDLGHTVVLIVGDFTAQIGDPSDKLEKRPILTKKLIQENIAGYKKQLGKILDLNRTEIVYNSSWLSKLRFDEICRLAETFSVQQMTNRRNFKERIEKGVEISLREFLYPLMQGYDSLMVRADVEIGGFDQLFNLKAGRIVQKHYGMPEQDILTGKMLLGTDGRKMSKSWGNVINIVDSADEMFGKTMALRDDLMADYFLLATDVPVTGPSAEFSAEKINARIAAGENPRDIKFELAKKIVTRYWGEDAAEKARAKFIEVFSQKKIPDDIETVHVAAGSTFVDAAVAKGIVKSKTEWRRLIDEGAVTDAQSGEAVTDHAAVAENKTLKIGKRRFLKVVVS